MYDSKPNAADANAIKSVQYVRHDYAASSRRMTPKAGREQGGKVSRMVLVCG